MADGRYEVKVVASDAAANPPGKGKTTSRVSDPVLVDNTPPVIGDVKSEAGRGADVTVDAKVVDRTSVVAAAGVRGRLRPRTGRRCCHRITSSIRPEEAATFTVPRPVRPASTR